ncbi:phosphatidate cytidylyltransferase [Reinekea marina]|uniref:Phosphatidate cytidylyltransferase n=1 Tax=Reinekea marina TaxID=1310421 RepID=A0ABV7WMI2_9GAMM|nr:phosphatidate cytidylyltransferase [Reinekea marina]MDN3649960.1 phosphatidate cytidylyltransferase [Reinekea marina]
MLFQRVLTALVLAPLMLAGIYWLPDLWFRGFIGIIVMLGAWEWAHLSGFTSMRARVLVGLLLGAVLFGLHYFVMVTDQGWSVMVLATLVWWAFAFVAVIRYPKHKGWLNSQMARLIAGIPVLAGLWMGLVWLKLQHNSVLLLTWFMLLVWGADIGAYFAGRFFGNRKLAPNVSPGKTWAGVYGGMATSILISVVIALFFLGELSAIRWVWLIALSVAVIAISVLGDLLESLMKRNSGIKDSSSLLPGHGGILDRIDSMCAAAPMFVLLWLVVAGA